MINDWSWALCGAVMHQVLGRKVITTLSLQFEGNLIVNIFFLWRLTNIKKVWTPQMTLNGLDYYPFLTKISLFLIYFGQYIITMFELNVKQYISSYIKFHHRSFSTGTFYSIYSWQELFHLIKLVWFWPQLQKIGQKCTKAGAICNFLSVDMLEGRF